MDKRYEAFCQADPLFYDSPNNAPATTVDGFAAGRELPAGWQREELADWLLYAPVGGSLPQQGWKIHVSACRDERRADPRPGLGVLRAARPAVQVPPGRAGAAAAQRQVRPARFERQVRHDLSGRRRDAGRGLPGTRRPAGRRARPLHPERPALGLRTGVRAVRRLRGPVLPRRRRPGARDRGSGRHAGAGPPGPGLHRAGLGAAARLPRPAPRRAERRDHHRAAVPDRTGDPLLQRRRPLRRAGHPDRRAGGAEGGSAARGAGRRRRRRGDPAAARTRGAGPARGPARGAGRARLLRVRRASLPGAGVHRGPGAEQGAGRAVPAGRSGRGRRRTRRVPGLGPRPARAGGRG